MKQVENRTDMETKGLFFERSPLYREIQKKVPLRKSQT